LDREQGKGDNLIKLASHEARKKNPRSSGGQEKVVQKSKHKKNGGVETLSKTKLEIPTPEKNQHDEVNTRK